MKSNLIKIIGGVIGVFILLLGGVYLSNEKKSVTVGSTGATDVVVAAKTAAATTTYQYLTTADTASTTLVGTVAGADQASIQICTTASTSASVLKYSVWFSVDQLSVLTASSTWFSETAPSASGGTVTITPVTRSLSLATTSIVTTPHLCSDDLVSPIGAKRMMVKYGVNGGNAGVWMQIVPKTGY